MVISVNWLKRYVDVDLSIEKLADVIGERLVEVEEVIDLNERYKDCVIVQVKKCEKLEGSDHLSVCQVDVGKKDLVQIVCGANNVHEGMMAVWLPPKSVVPETFDSEPFVLDARPLMGVMSNGMLASVRELGLGDDHDGIVEIDPKSAKPGDNFAEVFELNDTLLDIENKSLTHRPDCFGIIGFAREVAGVLGQRFVEPDILKDSKLAQVSDVAKLSVEITDPKLCPRYSAAVIDETHFKESPYLNQIQVDIAKLGMRSIDRIVDITNYLMLLTGQPLHAFDYDKLVEIGDQKDARIIVRPAKKGEKLELLDGKVVDCSEKDILITSNNKPVALAGAMGGANTAIDEKTKRIIIESATFNLFNMRGTQFRHGIFSEAITRFTKGQPAGLTVPVLNSAVEMVGGKVISSADSYPKSIKSKTIEVSVELVNNLLGTSFDFDEIISTLQNVGFKLTLQNDNFKVKAPWWRTDIHIAEDVIEEVGRLNGYNEIPLDVPKRGFVAPAPDKLGKLKEEIRETLSAMGANETLTYSFISGKILEKAGLDNENSYKIVNSISPELRYVRQSISPSLLDKVRINIKDKYNKFALFEMNQVYRKKTFGMTSEKVPVLQNNLGCVIAGADYYVAKKYLINVFDKFGIKVKFIKNESDGICARPLEPKRSARVVSVDEKIDFGSVGEYRSSIKRNFKLPEAIAGFEINIDKLLENAKLAVDLQKTSDFPSVERDITFKVESDLSYDKLEVLIRGLLSKHNLQYELKPISIWQGDDKKTKNISFALSFASYDKTLGAKEITDIMDSITNEVKKELRGEVI